MGWVRCAQQLLNQVELPQVELENCVLHSREHKADILRVCSTCEVRIDDFLFVRILILVELQDKVSGGFDILLRS